MHDDMRREFVAACRQLCEDLNVNINSIETEDDEHSDGSSFFEARGKGRSYVFQFLYWRETGNPGPKSQFGASLTIEHMPGVAPFQFDNRLQEVLDRGGTLPRWVAWAVHNFNIEYHPLNLSSRLQHMTIRVYGLPDYSDPTRDEAIIFLRGLKNSGIQELLVYKIRHIDREDKYRSFSYAFFVSGGHRPFWVFFPRCGGLDSGAAHRDLKLFEELIAEVEKKIVVKRESYDIDYDILEKFLFEHEERFAKGVDDDSEDLYELIHISSEAFGQDFADSFAKFQEHYKSRNFIEAIRALRVLVQRALTIACKKKRIDIKDMKDRENIVNLTGKLVGKNQILDPKLVNWFQAFSSVANLSAHDDYPSVKDLQNYYVKNRTLMTILLGTQLIAEIQGIILLKDKKKNPWHG